MSFCRFQSLAEEFCICDVLLGFKPSEIRRLFPSTKRGWIKVPGVAADKTGFGEDLSTVMVKLEIYDARQDR